MPPRHEVAEMDGRKGRAAGRATTRSSPSWKRRSPSRWSRWTRCSAPPGWTPTTCCNSVRKGYSGQGGPLTPISVSTSGGPLSAEEIRANAILEDAGPDEPVPDRRLSVALRHAGQGQLPLDLAALAIAAIPRAAGTRMHEGTDMAGAYGTPIYATADGVVTFAGWHAGYGRHIKIQHANRHHDHLLRICRRSVSRSAKGSRAATGSVIWATQAGPPARIFTTKSALAARPSIR